VSENHSNHQVHGGPGGHQNDRETLKAMAGQIKACFVLDAGNDSQGPCRTCPEPERFRAWRIGEVLPLSTLRE
jgi:hypothetical protein